jgi:hypothetical protein
MVRCFHNFGIVLSRRANNLAIPAALVETILLEKLGAAAEEARMSLGFAWADAM